MPDGLARAREELRKAQYNLAHYRRMGAPFSEIFSRLATDRVLAALSWVWDEQERAREHDWSKMSTAEILEDLRRILPFAGPITGH